MNEYNSLLINLSVFIGLLLIGYFVGGIVEKRHFKSILEREEKLLYFPVINYQNFTGTTPEWASP